MLCAVEVYRAQNILHCPTTPAAFFSNLKRLEKFFITWSRQTLQYHFNIAVVADNSFFQLSSCKFNIILHETAKRLE